MEWFDQLAYIRDRGRVTKTEFAIVFDMSEQHGGQRLNWFARRGFVQAAGNTYSLTDRGQAALDQNQL